jgi:sporulation protein YabP
MAYEQAPRQTTKEHSLNMLNREKLSLTGVQDVSGFDESLIVLVTSLGPLTIRGEGLHIDRIDLNAGQLDVRGKVSDLSYEEPAHEGGFWSRLFG